MDVREMSRLLAATQRLVEKNLDAIKEHLPAPKEGESGPKDGETSTSVVRLVRAVEGLRSSEGSLVAAHLSAEMETQRSYDEAAETFEQDGSAPKPLKKGTLRSTYICTFLC
jgi:hypothetical protein